MFLCCNNTKKKSNLYPKFILTHVNVCTIYVHESICAQEPCICAQEKHSVDVHPHARIHVYTVYTYKIIHSIYLLVHKMCISRAVCLDTTRTCHTCTHVARHCADKPCCACLRSLCAFILNKRRKSALYKEASIRKRALYLRKEPCVSANEPCISAQESCISAQKKRRADTHID